MMKHISCLYPTKYIKKKKNNTIFFQYLFIIFFLLILLFCFRIKCSENTDIENSSASIYFVYTCKVV